MTERTKEQFMDAVKGIEKHHVVFAMNALTPGIDWRGCSKGHMAESWARNIVGFRTTMDFTAERVARMARARQNGQADWHTLV